MERTAKQIEKILREGLPVEKFNCRSFDELKDQVEGLEEIVEEAKYKSYIMRNTRFLEFAENKFLCIDESEAEVLEWMYQEDLSAYEIDNYSEAELKEFGQDPEWVEGIADELYELTEEKIQKALDTEGVVVLGIEKEEGL